MKHRLNTDENKNISTETICVSSVAQKLVQKSGQRTRRTRRFLLSWQAGFVCKPTRLHSHLKSHGYSVWVAGDGNGRIHEHSVRAHFHGFCRVAGCAQPSIYDYRHGGLFDDDANLIARLDAAVRADG